MKQDQDFKYRMNITKLFAVIFFIVVVTTVLGVISVTRHDSLTDSFSGFEDGWASEDGRDADLKHLEEYGAVSKQIPALTADEILYFHAKSVNLEVLIDAETIYQTDVYATRLFGKTPGSYYVQIPIKKEYSGKQITIRTDSPYGDGSGKISSIHIGNGIDILLSHVNDKLPGFILNIVISFLGFILAIMYIPLRRLKLAPNEMLYLGLFSMDVGIYMTTDCGLLSIVTGKEAFWHMVAELWMMLIVIPLICYLDCKYPGKNNKRLVYILSAYCILDFAFCYIAHWLDWKDYHELITMTHISYIIVIIYFTYCVIRSIFQKKTGRRGYLTGPIFIFVGVVFDIFSWNFGAVADNTMFTRLGVLVFLLFEGLQIIEKVMVQYQEGLKAQLLSRLAYRDGLTDLLNRTSFMEDQDKMEKAHDCGLIAVFDANDLKKINDNYGHIKGDELIVTVAGAIDHIFGDIGKCYRIGGDEFVLLTGKNYVMEQFLEKLNSLPGYLEQKAVEKEMPISVAVGYTIWDDKKHHCFHDFLNEADGYMYEKKKQMKAERAAAVAAG